MKREQREDDLIKQLKEMVRTGEYPPDEHAHFLRVAAPVSEEWVMEVLG